MKKINALMVGFLFLITVAGALFAESAGSIQIKGSDTMVNLNQGLAEVYMSKNPKAFIAVTGGGSGTGIASLLGGTCDIAASSRKMKDKEIKQAEAAGIEPKECTIALDGLAVVVNPANPVSNLTIDQLADIFTGKITNWKDVGGVNSEIVILSRERMTISELTPPTSFQLVIFPVNISANWSIVRLETGLAGLTTTANPSSAMVHSLGSIPAASACLISLSFIFLEDAAISQVPPNREAIPVPEPPPVTAINALGFLDI